MCGFAGKFYFSPDKKPEPRLIKSMTDQIIHRGPDAEGLFFEGQVGLGHRRLKIIDLATGDQPMESACGRGVIAYNGEVYNFRELRAELEQKGRKFRTQSDTEVVLNAWLEWGELGLEKLRGIFAFAIYDRGEKKLLLCRDRYGVKPLYYYIGPDWISFGSELKSLLKDPELPRRMDPVAVYQFFLIGYMPAPKSGVTGASKLLPCHFLSVKDAQVSIKSYHQMPARNEYDAPGPELARKMVFEEIDSAVKDELVSDVPLGVFLSGGVDSSAITAAAVKASSGKIKTYTVGFEEAQWDESKWAKAVAGQFHAEHILLHNRAQDLVPLLEKIIWHFDEPHGNYTAVANYLLCQACKKEISVALAGAGGDELFAGYTHHLADKLINYYYAFTPGFLRRGLLAPFFAGLVREDQARSFRRRLSRSLGFEEPDLVVRHLRYLTMGAFGRYLTNGGLIGPDKISEKDRAAHDPYRHLARYAREYPGQDPFNSLLWLDLHTYLCDDILLMTDRMASASAMEVRVPLMDHKLVELMFTIPFSYKLPGTDKKHMLKKYLLQSLPREMVYRPKQGFGVPLQVWINGKLKGFFSELFESDLARKEDFISMPLARQLLKEHTEHGIDHTARIWMAAHYLLWKKTFAIS